MVGTKPISLPSLRSCKEASCISGIVRMIRIMKQDGGSGGKDEERKTLKQLKSWDGEPMAELKLPLQLPPAAWVDSWRNRLCHVRSC